MTSAPTNQKSTTRATASRRRKYVPAVGPRLRVLLFLVFAMLALLGVNSVYLAAISFIQWFTGRVYEDYFYQYMFLGHLVLGLAIVLPVVLFGIFHIKNAHNRPNRRAVRAGYALFTTAVLVLITGIALTRSFVDLKNPETRAVVYWLHVIAPLVAVWLFVLHRLAGPKIKWKVGMGWGAVAAVFALGMVAMHAQNPREWNIKGNPEGEKYFFPALSRTVDGEFIPAEILDNDQYCRDCHQDIHDSWMHSVHRFSSFNNPAYLASVRETREFSMRRDGDMKRSRFCAGCHDPVPFFSGRFNDPNYDDVNDPTAHAGITCTACHAITHVGQVADDGTRTVIGNGDYTIDVPVHYPFAFSDNAMLKWINHQLIKSKPGFHKKTFLKPDVHRSTAFCGTCHKVHLPEQLNDYKWLRGQNHYDSFRLSGVSGHGVSSFYYPSTAQTNCNTCHMPLIPSDDFGAKMYAEDESHPLFDRRAVHDHMFPSANTAMPRLVDMPDADNAVNKHMAFLEDVVRVDIFGVKPGGEIDDELIGPLRPELPALEPGTRYLFEVVIRTVDIGHALTEGTSDSNQLWLDTKVAESAPDGERVIGRSGGRYQKDNSVDEWSHFVNSFMLDREGNRISRRNAQDIFTPLYSNQIPPGAADVVHYKLTVPEDASGAITMDVKLQYRKFDTEYMRFVMNDEEYYNDLPIALMAHDRVTFPVARAQERSAQTTTVEPRDIPAWQRWNDYGIGLLRKGKTGQLREAEAAFERVVEFGHWHGLLNLARVYLKEGRVAHDAPRVLQRARDFGEAPDGTKPYQWLLLWLTAQVNKQNGNLNDAIRNYQQILEGGFEQAVGRNFDFTKDERVLIALADTLYLRALQERGETNRSTRENLLREAARHFEEALELDSEKASAHYGLVQVYRELGETEKVEKHQQLHAKYKPDDNARDKAISAARRKYPAADHAAEDIVIYDLQRPGAPELDEPDNELARNK